MFTPSNEPDHRGQLRDSVTDFSARAASPTIIRDALASPEGFSMTRWRDMAALGWTAVMLPENKGGLGMDIADLAALHQEVGRAALPEPLAIVPLLAALAMARGDNTDLAAQVLPDLAEGRRIASLAWQGRPGVLGAEGVGPRAKETAYGWRLSGQARFVPCATSASAMVVAASMGDGVGLFWLDNMPPLQDMGRHVDGSSQASAIVEGVTATSLIAGPDRGGAILEEVLDLARLAASAELLGLMERALEMTLDHLRQREQFGKPIGSFQALQHRAVNLFIQIELARSALDRAVRALDGGTDAATRAAQVSAAKARTADAAQLVAKEAIQMHGAIGYTQEYDLSLYVNRILYLSGWLGNAKQHRARWAAHSLAGGHDHDG